MNQCSIGVDNGTSPHKHHSISLSRNGQLDDLRNLKRQQQWGPSSRRPPVIHTSGTVMLPLRSGNRNADGVMASRRHTHHDHLDHPPFTHYLDVANTVTLLSLEIRCRRAQTRRACLRTRREAELSTHHRVVPSSMVHRCSFRPIASSVKPAAEDGRSRCSWRRMMGLGM